MEGTKYWTGFLFGRIYEKTTILRYGLEERSLIRQGCKRVDSVKRNSYIKEKLVYLKYRVRHIKDFICPQLSTPN